MNRHRPATPLTIAVGVALLAVTACGPSAPLNVGVQHEGVGVFFGSPSATPSTPPPQPAFASLVPNFPGPVVPPPPPLFQPIATPAPPNPCPTPTSLAFPKVAATTSATQPPAASTYTYRYAGTETFLPGTPGQVVKQLPTTGTHQIVDRGAPAADGSYSFDVVEVYNGIRTTTTYLMEPNATPTSVIGSSGASQQPGMYLQQVVSIHADGSGQPESFTPNPPVELMPFPAVSGTTFQSGGVDPLSQTAMEIDPNGGTVVARERVATCGDLVDSWRVEIIGRFVAQRGSDVRPFDLTFNLATQYGGLEVAEHDVESGTDQSSGEAFKYDLTETVNTVPLDPGHGT